MAAEKDFKTLTIWERDYQTLFTKKFENRKKYEIPNPNFAFSFIPGTIQDLMVTEGQVVKKGEPMLVLESMKMLNLVKTPVDGKIKKIHITKGERIPKNYLMIEFE